MQKAKCEITGTASVVSCHDSLNNYLLYVYICFFLLTKHKFWGRYQRIWGLICSLEVNRKYFSSCISWPCFLKWLWWKTWSQADVKHLVWNQGLSSTECWVKLARKWNICFRKNVKFLEFLSDQNKNKTSCYRESKWTERASAWSTAKPSSEGNQGSIYGLQHLFG